ncbi:hypothetical protein Clacol_009827 [Clathrus columnatus]|uniref:Cyclin-like domain-containing protein n=1 Tax=Clathrus columnatus TaxID=1419009 RepID=A0AAV5AS19_9AGAM|nr:hypothetical protein Clacol_009827 [Clathrus columnatus]
MDVDSSTPTPKIFTRYYHPYFSSVEVEGLSTKQRGKLSTSQEEKQRQQACAFIEAVGARIGFPRKTIATGQNLYHRFHLFFSRKDFNPYDVALASLYASTKMNDTLKKPQDLLMVSYIVRYPDLAAKSKAVGGEVAMNPEKVEQDRVRLLGIERYILETICFNFNTRIPFPYVIKIAKAIGASKLIANLAWRLATDSSRTLVHLQYPPHCIALSCLYLAGLLLSFEASGSLDASPEKNPSQIADYLGTTGPWENQFQCLLEDIQEISHIIMDLLLHESTSTSSTHTSPSTPQSPSPYAHNFGHASHPYHHQQQQQPLLPPPSIPYHPDQLTRLKIQMRERDVPRERKRNMDISLEGIKLGTKSGGGLQDTIWVAEAEGLGTNVGTARFLFGPMGSIQAAPD